MKKEEPRNGRYTKEEPRKWRVKGPDGRYTYAIIVPGFRSAPEQIPEQKYSVDLSTWYKLREYGGSAEWMEKLDTIISGLEQYAATVPPILTPPKVKEPKEYPAKEEYVEPEILLEEHTLKLHYSSPRFKNTKDWQSSPYNDKQVIDIDSWIETGKIPKGWMLMGQTVGNPLYSDEVVYKAIKPYDFRKIAPKDFWSKLEKEGECGDPWKDWEPLPKVDSSYYPQYQQVINGCINSLYFSAQSRFATDGTFEKNTDMGRAGCFEKQGAISEAWIYCIENNIFGQSLGRVNPDAYIWQSIKKWFMRAPPKYRHELETAERFKRLIEGKFTVYAWKRSKRVYACLFMDRHIDIKPKSHIGKVILGYLIRRYLNDPQWKLKNWGKATLARLEEEKRESLSRNPDFKEEDLKNTVKRLSRVKCVDLGFAPEIAGASFENYLYRRILATHINNNLESGTGPGSFQLPDSSREDDYFDNPGRYTDLRTVKGFLNIFNYFSPS